MSKTIGVLALQGAFIEHIHVLHGLGVNTREIRQRRDFTAELDGLIIPGGESTAISKLMVELGLYAPVQQAIHQGLPVFGTCAGAILLAKTVSNGYGDLPPTHLATMDIAIQRNAYGRQLGSFFTEQAFGQGSEAPVIPMTFIRAPLITAVHHDTQVLATVNGGIVAAQQGKQLACTFHPELNTDAVHRYFLTLIR